MPIIILVALLALSVSSAIAGPYPGHPETSPDITAADLAARDKALADNEFEGRGPGTKTGEASAAWIADEMKRIGLEPGNQGSFFQNIRAVTITLDPAASRFSITTPKGQFAPKFRDEIVYWTPHYKSPDIGLKKSDLVFVGYGVIAPEYGWNDYAGADVKGKTVVILINDPGNEDANPDPAFFKGKAMTYYGRWTYKYEEAARQGAAAAIIVHETAPAAYGWQVVQNSNSGPKDWLDTPNKGEALVPIQGWIHLDAARALFETVGMDYGAMKKAANQRGFKAVPMTGASLDVLAHSAATPVTTRNVVGMIKGSAHPDEIVVYTAHWDHFGLKQDTPGADKIYHGAVDNGLGVSEILEIAEAFAKSKPHPQRSVAFLSVTLEEQGLLGSQYFAEHPIWPVNKIVGGINIDNPYPEGTAHDMIVIGNGASDLEDILAAELKRHDRVISPDPQPENGTFYRSDHISLAKVGIPMLDPNGGFDLIQGGKDAGLALREDYRKNRYHQPADKFDPNWDLSGPVEDAKIYFEVGKTIANSTFWPNWYSGNEFRAIRDKSRGS